LRAQNDAARARTGRCAASARIISAPFSPIMMMAALVLPDTSAQPAEPPPTMM
jgi:hypothetical protein